MSLKSFDKFCEKMILGQPAEREIMDERQKIARTQIAVEALTAFSALSFVNSLVMDVCYRWAESCAAPMVIFMFLCLIYYNIRCFAKGCLVGVNGGKALIPSAVSTIFMSVMMGVKYAFDADEERFLFADGKITDNFCFLAGWILFFVYGIVTIILVKASKKSDKEDKS
ncbi:MAG: hypothetical protein NC299_06365 [Lachnospiraceae bacterium]|nr:hypothetical protein [Ruminococcus sp.]MCM1274978.1 hypothetical protein [Lachnospiraceae bacterium]